MCLVRAQDELKACTCLSEHFNDVFVFSNIKIDGIQRQASYDKALTIETDNVVILVSEPLPKDLSSLVTRARKRCIFVQGNGSSLAEKLKIDDCIVCM